MYQSDIIKVKQLSCLGISMFYGENWSKLQKIPKAPICLTLKTM
jgi:hypothetical protein